MSFVRTGPVQSGCEWPAQPRVICSHISPIKTQALNTRVCVCVLSFIQGLSYLAARDLLGHEPLAQADLLLKLAAGRALAGMAGVPAPGSAGYTDVWVYRALFSGVGVCVCMCDCVCMCNCVEC